MRIRSDNVTWREVEGEIVALDLVSSTYFTANSSATDLWKLLCDGAEKPELVAHLQSTYGLDGGAAERDVEAFLEELRAQRLLQE